MIAELIYDAIDKDRSLLISEEQGQPLCSTPYLFSYSAAYALRLLPLPLPASPLPGALARAHS